MVVSQEQATYCRFLKNREILESLLSYTISVKMMNHGVAGRRNYLINCVLMLSSSQAVGCSQESRD
jgi:hypothetical protein